MADIIELLIYGVICNRFSWLPSQLKFENKAHPYAANERICAHTCSAWKKIRKCHACSCSFYDTMLLLYYAESYCSSVVSDIWDSSYLSNIFPPPPFMAHQLRDELRKETLQLASECACPFPSNHLSTFSICYRWERLNITIFYIRGELGEWTTDYGA
jgi:hypothetical protein